jgi:hypothetical protein
VNLIGSLVVKLHHLLLPQLFLCQPLLLLLHQLPLFEITLLLGFKFSAFPRFLLLSRAQCVLLLLVLFEHTGLLIDFCGAGNWSSWRGCLCLDCGRTSGQAGSIAGVEEIWWFLNNLRVRRKRRR